MGADLPSYYFRVRENGAAVFRVDTENRQRRIDMEEIAVVNIKNGNIKPHGDRTLTPVELALIRDWAARRVALLAALSPAWQSPACTALPTKPWSTFAPATL